METLNKNPSVHIFGAGHVSQALCRILVGTPFQIHVIDKRKEWLDAINISDSITKHPDRWQDFVNQTLWDAENIYVIIMTHSHPIDQEILFDIIGRPTKYIGLIGSHNKWLDFQLHFRNKGISKEQLKKVHCPIGLKLPGKAPQEIAISIAMELLSLHYEVSKKK